MLARLVCLVFLVVNLSACAPSVAERASRDIAAAFVRADYNSFESQDETSVLDFMATDPILRSEALWLAHTTAYSLGYTLGVLLVP